MQEALIAFAVMLGLTFPRLPIAFSMALVGFLGFAYIVNTTAALSMVGSVAFETGMSYTLSIVPLFILMGNLVTRAGLSSELYRVSYAFLGPRRGGLAMATHREVVFHHHHGQARGPSCARHRHGRGSHPHADRRGVQREKISFRKVADILTGSIIKRLSMGRDHGVAILAEGIAERFDCEELCLYEPLERDETGRVRLSEIQLGSILKNFVRQSLDEMGIKITIVDKNIGYELRAAAPIPFDEEYTRNLGYGAVRYLLRGGSGAMIVFDEGRLRPIPFVEMIDEATGKSKVRMVDTTSENYVVGRNYMIRIEKEDLSGENLDRLARTARMTAGAFLERFVKIC